METFLQTEEFFWCVLERVCICLALGRILTVYFKRAFSFSKHGGQIILDVVPLLISLIVSRFLGSRLCVPLQVLSLLFSIAQHGFHGEKIKTVVLSVCISLVLYGEGVGVALLGKPLTQKHFESGMLVAASTQLLRNPDRLKLALSEFRIVCGPLYPILACGLASFVPCEGLLDTLTASVTAIAAVAAATLFRPDNNATIDLIPKLIPSLVRRRRKLIHGLLMAGSCLVTFLKMCSSLGQDEADKTVTWIGVVFGAVNVMFYLTFKLIARSFVR